MQKKRRSEHYAKIEVDKSAFAREQKCHKVFDWQLIFFLSLVVQFRNQSKQIDCVSVCTLSSVLQSLLHLASASGRVRETSTLREEPAEAVSMSSVSLTGDSGDEGSGEAEEEDSCSWSS